MISSFHGAPCAKPSSRKIAKEMQSLMELPKVQSNRFKALYEGNSYQFLLSSALYKAIYKQKIHKNLSF